MCVCVRACMRVCVCVCADAHPYELYLINSLQTSFCTDSTKTYIAVDCYQNVNLTQLSTKTRHTTDYISKLKLYLSYHLLKPK